MATLTMDYYPLFCLLLFIFSISLTRWLSLPHSNVEPPLVSQRFPFIGHVFEILRHGSEYYTKIRRRTNFSAYTLGMPRKKVYIIAEPHLTAQVDRNSKTISFAPYVVLFAKKILIPSKKSLEILAENLEEEGTWGCRLRTMKAMHISMAPGDDLDSMTAAMLSSLAPAMVSKDKLSPCGRLSLYKWVKRAVTKASTDAIYGAIHNPFQDERLVSSFWSVNDDFALLALGILPSIIAPKGHRGRKQFFDAFLRYYDNNAHLTGSRLVKARYEVNRSHGISIDDIAHFELSICIALLVNTVPATFWCLYNVYSRPALLETVRIGIASFVKEVYDEEGLHLHTIDIAELLSDFPLLQAIVRETLRLLSMNASGRVVLRDVLLNGTYLLKKDALLLIPSAELHSDPSIWGKDFADFNPERWLRSGTKTSSSAYRAFGGGSSLCPGRYLSMNEILIGLVVMVTKYDLHPIGGTWKILKTGAHITTSILTPKEDIEVDVADRGDHGQTLWTFTWRGVQISTVDL